MKRGILKKVSVWLFVAVLVIFALVATPRIAGFLFPGKLPVGYHFEWLTYLAVGIGFEDVVNLAPEIPADIEVIENVEYKQVNGLSLQVDFYKPTDVKGPLPLLVFVHGGSWKGGKRSDYMVYLLKFAEKGYMTATVSYRLMRDSIYPAAVEDVGDALVWLSEHGELYGYNPDRMALIGGSAGAHLALLAAYGWHREGVPSGLGSTAFSGTPVRAVVDIYGPADLTTPYARTQSQVVSFLGQSYETAPDLYRNASPVHWLHERLPPTLIMHGSSDKLVPVSQSDHLKHKLDSLGVVSEYYRFPFWPHTMDIASRVNVHTTRYMEAFFEKHVR